MAVWLQRYCFCGSWQNYCNAIIVNPQ